MSQYLPASAQRALLNNLNCHESPESTENTESYTQRTERRNSSSDSNPPLETPSTSNSNSEFPEADHCDHTSSQPDPLANPNLSEWSTFLIPDSFWSSAHPSTDSAHPKVHEIVFNLFLEIEKLINSYMHSSRAPIQFITKLYYGGQSTKTGMPLNRREAFSCINLISRFTSPLMTEAVGLTFLTRNPKTDGLESLLTPAWASPVGGVGTESWKRYLCEFRARTRMFRGRKWWLVYRAAGMVYWELRGEYADAWGVVQRCVRVGDGDGVGKRCAEMGEFVERSVRRFELKCRLFMFLWNLRIPSAERSLVRYAADAPSVWREEQIR